MSESFRPAPESAPVDKEDDSGTEPEKKNKTKEKKDTKTRKLGGITAESVVEPPRGAREAEDDPKTESLWQQLTRTDKSPDGTDSLKSGLAFGEKADDVPPPLETLTAAEEQEAVKQYVAARLEDVPAEETSAENAADTTLLETIQQKIAEEPDKPVAEVLDEAEQEVVETIQSGVTAEGDMAEVAEDRLSATSDEIFTPEATDSAGNWDASEAGTVIEHEPDTGGDAAASGSAGGSGGGAPPPRGTDRSSGAMPLSAGGGPVAGRGFNTAPVTTVSRMAAEQQLYATERAAVARGLIVGGVVGYLIGKRRGRIKTEKKLVPVQEKLQKQVESLTLAVAEKEQRVRTLAAEKAAVLQTQVEKQRFTERLRPAPAAEVTAAKSARPEQAGGPGGLQVERLGKMIVETPAAVFAGAGVGGRAAESLYGKPDVAIDFSKKVETYSAEELREATEKVRIDGVSLKEIQNNYRLDEQAVRRVVRQFVEGGNVREALNREIVETELKYERDPRMRSANGGGPDGGGGTAAVAGAAVLSLLGATGADAYGRTNGSGTGTKGMDSPKGPPKPDQATLDKLRRKQATELMAASVTIVVFFAVLIVILL